VTESDDSQVQQQQQQLDGWNSETGIAVTWKEQSTAVQHFSHDLDAVHTADLANNIGVDCRPTKTIPL